VPKGSFIAGSDIHFKKRLSPLAVLFSVFLIMWGYAMEAYPTTTNERPDNNSSIPHMKGLMAFTDFQGRVWIGWEGGQAVSSDNGASWTGFRRRVFTNCSNINKFGINVYDSDETNLFTEDSNGNIWYATQGGGIVKLNGSDPTQTPQNFAPSSSPTTWATRSVIYHSDLNVFYVTTTHESRRGTTAAEYEFWVYDPTVTSRAKQISDLVHRTLFGERALIDNGGSCTPSEPTNIASAWTKLNSTVTNLLTSQFGGGSPTFIIEDMAVDDNGHLWIINRKNGNGSISGTFGGIIRLVPSGKTGFSSATAFKFTDSSDASAGAVADFLALEKAGDGTLYAGTDEGGSYKFKPGTDSDWSLVATSDFPGTVEDIAEDPRGRLWFVGNANSFRPSVGISGGTNSHASLFNPSTRAVVATKTAQELMTEAGLSGSPNGSSIKGVTVDDEGNVYFNFFPFQESTSQPRGLFRTDEFQITSTISLNRSIYGGTNFSGSVTVTVETDVGSVTVNLKSTTNTTGVNLSLNQIARAQTWQGSFGLTTTGSSSGSTLRVSDGDTITATYTADGISTSATFDEDLVPAMGFWAVVLTALSMSVFLIWRKRTVWG
jgi:hypothetical protein